MHYLFNFSPEICIVGVHYSDNLIITFNVYTGTKLHKLKLPMLMTIMCGTLHGILLDIFCAGELYLALCHSILL